MAYVYKGKEPYKPEKEAAYIPISQEEAAAKFAYFRQAELQINGGPVPIYPEVTELRAPQPRSKRRPPAKCGTNPGYQRCRKTSTGPCEPCRAAKTEYQRAYRARRALIGPPARPYGSKPGPNPKPLGTFNPDLCGTLPGWRQHAKHGIKRCRKCKDAHNAYHAQWRAKIRQAA